MPRVLIAGGGSGGHVAPAIAVAEELQSHGIEVLLGHSGRKIDLAMIEQSGFDHVTIPAAPLHLTPKGLFTFCKQFKNATTKTENLIESRQITCVLSTGGFVAAPALRAGYKSDTTTVLLNLDNPPGKANKLAVRWADYMLTTVECGWKDATLVPLPLRKESIEHPDSESCKNALGLDPRLSTLLVTGASQGAQTINELIPLVAKQSGHAFKGWQVLHIAGETNVKQVEEFWKGIDVPVHIVGFVNKMGYAWGAADFAVTRGGANTIAEIAIHAVPTIVMPYPYHRDNHQRTNAAPLAAINGIVLAYDYQSAIRNTQEVGPVITRLLTDHLYRLRMREALNKYNQINGAKTIAEFCLKVLQEP